MTNSIKLNGSIKVILTVATLIAIIAAGGIAWGSLSSRVDATEDDVTEMKDDLREIRSDIKELLKRVPEKE